MSDKVTLPAEWFAPPNSTVRHWFKSGSVESVCNLSWRVPNTTIRGSAIRQCRSCLTKIAALAKAAGMDGVR